MGDDSSLQRRYGAMALTTEVLGIIFIVAILAVNAVFMKVILRNLRQIKACARRYLTLISMAAADIFLAVFSLPVLIAALFGFYVEWSAYCLSKVYMEYCIHFVYGTGLITLGVDLLWRRNCLSDHTPQNIVWSLLFSAVPWILCLVLVLPLTLARNESCFILEDQNRVRAMYIVSVILPIVLAPSMAIFVTCKLKPRSSLQGLSTSQAPQPVSMVTSSSSVVGGGTTAKASHDHDQYPSDPFPNEYPDTSRNNESQYPSEQFDNVQNRYPEETGRVQNEYPVEFTYNGLNQHSGATWRSPNRFPFESPESPHNQIPNINEYSSNQYRLPNPHHYPQPDYSNFYSQSDYRYPNYSYPPGPVNHSMPGCSYMSQPSISTTSTCLYILKSETQSLLAVSAVFSICIFPWIVALFSSYGGVSGSYDPSGLENLEVSVFITFWIMLCRSVLTPLMWIRHFKFNLGDQSDVQRGETNC